MTLRFLRSLAKVLFCGTIGAVMLSLLPWKLALIAFLFGCLFVFWRGAQTMLILLIASSAYGQFGGVQQPMFATPASGIVYPAEDLLLFWSTSDLGASNDVTGTTITNSQSIDWWYYRYTKLPTAFRFQTGSIEGGTEEPVYYTNGPAGYPYLRTLGNAASGEYFQGESAAGVGDIYGATTFIVFRPHAYGGLSCWNVSGGTATWWFLSGTSPYPTFTLWDNGTARTAQGYLPTNKWSLVTVGLRDASGFMRSDGISVLTNEVTGGLRLSYNANYSYPRSSSGAGLDKLSDIVEIRVYTNGLAYPDMETIETMLMTKYGITTGSTNSTLLLSYDIDALGLNDGDAISTLPDDGPYGYDLAATQATNRPYWTNNVAEINGEGYAYFDGNNDYLTNNFNVSYSQPYHVFVISKGVGIPGVYSLIWAGGNPAMFEYNNTGTETIYGGSLLSTPFTDNWIIWEALFNGPVSVVKTNNVTAVTGNIGTEAFTGMFLGNSSLLSGPFLGGIANFQCYTNMLSFSAASNLVSELGTRYGITTYTRN